ncbi:hypothetical protein AB4238_00345 [Shewanella sp. 10N.286.45.A1]|uniref:hypothetical protein n=1 Tax=Shewanella sp. 10N.286.45.A1 TaxID=3229694 RepID=UPI003553E232
MGKNLCLVLGNGFSIDLIKQAKLEKEIDVVNLFSKGAEIPWPETGQAGYLSFKHCPNLWNLGARPNMGKDDAMALLENIITCLNVHILNNKPRVPDGSAKPNDIYINAYYELTSYLRTLFSYYNSLVPDGSLTQKLDGWAWLDFLKRANESEIYESISIITYNYDTWLERLLIENDISFKLSQVEGGNNGESPKITLIKPHGSISFYHKNQSLAEYEIGYGKDIPGEATTDDFETKYDIPLSKCLVNALVPPAGDTERIKQSWSGQIRTSAAGCAKKLKSGDELMICGISYWHVDRSEIDELITCCSPEVNTFMFNPYPNVAMDAVLTSLFKNYVYHDDSSVLNKRLML